MIIQCCVCKMVKWGNGWRFDGQGGRADASHTYCPHCLEACRADIRAERAHADRKQPLSA